MNKTIFPTRISAGIFIFLHLLICPIVTADELSNPVSVTTRITPDTFTLGDIATYTISVQHDTDIQPTAPSFSPPKGLEIIDNGESSPQSINGQTLHEYWYKLRVDDIGKLAFPPIPLTFDAPDPKEAGKTIQGTILTPEAILEVQSLLDVQGSQEGIRDIKPLEEIDPPWMHYIWMALGALVLCGLLYFFWNKWRARTSKPVDAPKVPALTPEQLAYKELEALRVKGWLQIGRTQDHFFELSEIFRSYLENRYQFPAREWTTEEISAHFKYFPKLSENLKHQARAILTQTDRIKFAKADLEEGQVDIKTIIEFIREACPTKTESVLQISS
jgi:hypothetical protein